MAEWNISKPSGICCGNGNEIQPGQEYYGALVEGEEGLERKDFSAEYWESSKPEVYCYWKSIMADPEEKKKIFIDDDMLVAFFERLENETEQEKVDFRFVLTLVLMRKRILKYLSSRIEDGKEIWKLRHVPRKEEVEVVNPELDESRIESLESQISQIMQGELE